ncbi:hypothetical protein L2E82_37807 [Cichorium intybus]|uniref:Uncharacterized protein n=1 Tax=Cichorium intybus TaxID=13427 RepID=A0ACB9AED7_CICIN|nr:hypothetical protein L2E82_37807 [Cichorium intybus]
MAPIMIEENEDDSLDDSDFILGKQYKILSRKLDALLQSNTGFDPTKKPEASVEDEIAEAQKALTGKMEELVKASEKRILDQQIEIQRILERKLNTAIEQVEERHRLLKEQNDKKIDELVKNMELLYSKLKKDLYDLRDETDSFNSQYQTSFAKHLSDAHKRVEELNAEQSTSTVAVFANELRNTNQPILTDVVTKLKNTLQPLINLAKTTTEPQTTYQSTILGRPPFIPPILSKAGPTFETTTTTTTEAGGSSSQSVVKEIRIAPYMEQVNQEREEEYKKILIINNIALENQTWTEELITAIDFNDFHVNNRLPLKSLETKTGFNQQLDLPYNPKTFAFLQFERQVPKKNLPLKGRNG